MNEESIELQAKRNVQRRREAEALVARLRKVLPPILSLHPVLAAYVYGSVARGTATPLSDLDLALVLSTDLDGYDRLMLELTIQADIEDALGFSPVDVRAINKAPLMVKGQIIQYGILVHEQDHDALAAFEVATRKRYFDFAPVARRLQEAFLKDVHEKGILRGRS